MEAALESYVRVFPARPAETGRRMRELYDTGPEEFIASAEDILRQYEPGAGTHYLLGILASHEELIPTLCRLSEDPEFPLAALMRSATSMEPGLEARLTKQLEQAAARENQSMRSSLMRMLDACRRASNLVPALSRLVQSADHHISSKATLLAGRAVESQAWFHERMADPEPRVRANAVEALWNSHMSWAPEIFSLGARDPHPRVVANAHIGLFLDGRLDGLRGLIAMGELADIGVRTSGAWALGQIGDPRGLPALKRMLSEPPGRLTRNALAAIRRIGRLQTDRRLGASSVLCCLDSAVAGGKWKALVTFHHPPPPDLLRETHWLVGSPEGWSHNLEVELLENGGSPRAVLVGPQLLEFDLGAALSGMPSPVQWAAVRFAPGRTPRAMNKDSDGQWNGTILRLDESQPAPKPTANDFEPETVVTFSAFSRHVEKAWHDAANPMRPAASFVHVLDKCFNALGRAGKVRHVVVLATERLDPVTREMLPGFATKARVNGIAIHLLGLRHLPEPDREPYENLCRAAGGFRLWVNAVEDLRHSVRGFLAGMGFRVRLQAPVEDLPKNRVVVCHQANGHFDEIEVPLPQASQVNS